MKLLYLTLEYQYAPRVVEVLENRGVANYLYVPRVHGRDAAGRHEGSQVFPGYMAMFWVHLEDQDPAELLSEIRGEEGETKRKNLSALVLDVEKRL
jgi:hypothetical protein